MGRYMAAELEAATFPGFNTLVVRFSTRRDCLQRFAIRLRAVWPELCGNTEFRTPVLTTRCGLGHDRFDAKRFERFRHFFHLSSSPFAMNNNTCDHVICETLPIDSRKAFGQRREDPLVSAVR